MSAEPTITCPQCQTEVKLTESLAAPMLQAARREYDQKLAKQNAEVAKRELAVKELQAKLATEKESLDAQVIEKVKAERTRIAADEARKAKLALSDDLEQKARELAELHVVLKQRDEKLGEAQKAQADLIRKQRELDDAKREMELTIETRVQNSLTFARDQAKQQAEQELSLKVLEKEHIISSMQKQIEELKRKAEQGSQQLQGEALELHLQNILTDKFTCDRIEPVPKGEHGGDILHRVCSATGSACGTIIWESKRTKNWSDLWLGKLREDQRSAKAEIAVIVSMVLPKGVESFDQVDGVWIVHPRCVLPVALSLRQMLIEVSTARQASEGQQTKMELVYHYLTGPRFRLRVQAIVEAFSTMSDELAKEKKSTMKQWAKREMQLDLVLRATAGMYGELQGIAGKSLQEIEGLLPADAEEGITPLLGREEE